jgi:hypothetical protein
MFNNNKFYSFFINITTFNYLTDLNKLFILLTGPITQAAPCQDSVYYEQLIPPLIQSIHHAVRAGKLGLQQAGNFLLVRHEDRLAYIQIMEKGNGYMIYSAKGLELQETSCHSLEATRFKSLENTILD